jgi:hypothetical protein
VGSFMQKGWSWGTFEGTPMAGRVRAQWGPGRPVWAQPQPRMSSSSDSDDVSPYPYANANAYNTATAAFRERARAYGLHDYIYT